MPILQIITPVTTLPSKSQNLANLRPFKKYYHHQFKEQNKRLIKFKVNQEKKIVFINEHPVNNMFHPQITMQSLQL
jgi:hypothetical protein